MMGCALFCFGLGVVDGGTDRENVRWFLELLFG
jgi:hypothetical protein